MHFDSFRKIDRDYRTTTYSSLISTDFYAFRLHFSTSQVSLYVVLLYSAQDPGIVLFSSINAQCLIVAVPSPQSRYYSFRVHVTVP